VVAVASIMIALGNSSTLIMAANLLQVSYILDNADGQLARYRKSFSRFGHWLDSTCDRICELFIIASLTYRFSQVNNKALFFGFYALFLIYYYHGAEEKALPLLEAEEKKEVEAKEGPLMSKITRLRHKLRWIPFNVGEQYFLFFLFLLLNRIDLFFYFFVSYGTIVTMAFPLYKYYHYRLSLRKGE
jgi:phosphatidylglycerophosphate synthase